MLALLLASLAVQMDVPELARKAELVVHGKVVSAESSWQDGRIVTRSTLRIDETLKGKHAAKLQVLTLGGAVGDLAQNVPGEAALAPGEEVVLFLVKTSGALRVLGLAQGKFHVAADGTAAQDLAGLDGAGPALKLPLTALRKQIARRAR